MSNQRILRKLKKLEKQMGVDKKEEEVIIVWADGTEIGRVRIPSG